MNIKLELKTILGILTLLSVLTSAITYGVVKVNQVDSNTARVAAVEKKLTINEIKELLRAAEAEVYYYKDLLRKYPNDVSIQRKLEQAEAEVVKYEEMLKEAEQS